MASRQHSLVAGLELSRSWEVTRDHLYNPAGIPGREVLSSPSMILEMEITCGDLVREHLAPGHTTVGFHVDVKHIAPSSPGATITTVALLKTVSDDRLTFAVEARDGGRLIGVGKHRRAIIPIDPIER